MKTVLMTLAFAGLLAMVPFSFEQVKIGSAEARVGRPLTPVSVAGAHRRHHRYARRTAYGAAAVGAAYGAHRYYGGGYHAGCRCY